RRCEPIRLAGRSPAASRQTLGGIALSFAEHVRERARARVRRIVFPESMDARIVEAALLLTRERLLTPILVGSAERFSSLGLAIPEVALADPAVDPGREALAEHLYRRRKERGLTRAE